MSTKKGSDSRRKSTCLSRNRDDLQRAVGWVLDPTMFADVAVHGNVSWTAVALVRLVIFWVWSNETSLVAAADEAISSVTRIFGSSAVRSYQALTGALKRYGEKLLPLVWSRLHHLMEKCDGESWQVGVWLALAVDGSRVSLPRTEANEERCCKRPSKERRKRKKYRGRHAKNRRLRRKGPQKSHYDPQAVGPQMWLTLLWHIGLRMPWCWRIGPSYSSEREHLLWMLANYQFPQNTLFCADAGFVGYNFWRGINDATLHFLIRVGGNVRLLKKLGYYRERDTIVYCWPDEAMKNQQPPLVLRLLRFQTSRGDVFLVTNVLSETELPPSAAAQLYRLRWGVELQFRAFKQTYQRSKLRSRTPDCAEVELHWSLVGLWIIQLLALKEQTRAEPPQEQTSIASVLRIMRTMIKDESQIRVRGESLPSQLAKAVVDDYRRNGKKQSRNYPRRKEEPSAGAPIIRTATKLHKQQLQKMQWPTQAA